MKVLFVDPGSRSTGWALFVVTVAGVWSLTASGTITAEGKNPYERLLSLWKSYSALGKKLKPQEVHIERMNYKTHYYCTWSAGLIGGALMQCRPSKIDEDISPTAWQAVVQWRGDRELLKPYLEKVRSADELAAIGMGIYWFGRERT